MGTEEWDVVTGAFGYTGRYITERLLSMGRSVMTITCHPTRPNPWGERMRVAPFNFDNPADLAKTLEGATTLYNTYWVRFPHGKVTFEKAVENTRVLINAARESGIRRIVHISITNASKDSPLPYFKGKGLVEEAVVRSELPYAIIRPTVIFGGEDILINNIAWQLRRFPVFAVFGRGDYQLQPIFVEDLADIAVDSAQRGENVTIDAVGPEVYTFEELVRLIAEKIGHRARIIHLRPGLALFISRLVGFVVRDVLITSDEVKGLMSNLLVSKGPATAPTRISQWLADNANSVGASYASELDRHYR